MNGRAFKALFPKRDKTARVFEAHSDASSSFQPLVLAGRQPVPESQPDAHQGAQEPDWEAEIERARQAGREEAFEEGEAELSRLRQELEQSLAIVRDLEKARSEAVRQAAQDVGELVHRMCARVLRGQLAVEAAAFDRIVADAMASFPAEDALVISVPPDRVEATRSFVGERHDVRADDSLTEGCRVETEYASIESSIATALSGIESAIAQWAQSQG